MASNILITAVKVTKFNGPTAAYRQKLTRAMSTLKPSIRDKMERYAIEDGTPIFKKAGSLDNLLYMGTMGLCVVSLGLIARNLYLMASKK